MNNLATIEKIIDIQPIENADSIEVATVLGWNIVVKKGEFKIGDLCSYIQIDTIVPEEEQFKFLRPRGFRVRTIKLRGQISQGLIIPVPIGKYKEGDNLTTILGIKKYSKDTIIIEKAPKSFFRKYWWLFKNNIWWKLFPNLKPILGGKAFPSHLVSKTDEERIQNLTKTFEKYHMKHFVVSEKLNGSSITIINDKKLRICSRNQEVTGRKDNKFISVVENTNFKQYIDRLIEHYNTKDIIVQGEYVGSPQGNYYNLDKDQIFLFNIIINKRRVKQNEFYEICLKYNIPSCPLITSTYMMSKDNSIEKILKQAEFKSKMNDKVEAEGLVFRCIEDNFSFKVVSNKYLIKNEE